jgi:AcrR family transcriptional regulator
LVTATSAARPRGARLPRQARRRQLLGAAQEVFVSQGYHAAAMDEIAERAGISKPVLYQHFPSKLELYLDTVRSALGSTTDNKQRVAATFGAYFGFVANQGGAYRLVFESDLSNEPAVRERLDRSVQECAEMISDVIKGDTTVPDDAAHLLGVGLVGTAQVSARYWLRTGQQMPQEEAEQLMARLTWRGISGFPLSS